jgi:SAM-dependent methyltransferase
MGVGTGRVSAPLAKAGIAVVGMDISRRMMERARSKGLPNLVLAEGRLSPFKEQSFDGVIMAHVFHLLEDPLAVLREAARVAKVGVFALLRKRGAASGWFPFYGVRDPSAPDRPGFSEDTSSQLLEEQRERFRKIADKYHWRRDPSRFRDWSRERTILESSPPDEIHEVSSVLVTDTVENRIARLQKGGYSFTSGMPAEMIEEVVKELRTSASAFKSEGGARHVVYQVAFWRSCRLLEET